MDDSAAGAGARQRSHRRAAAGGGGRVRRRRRAVVVGVAAAVILAAAVGVLTMPARGHPAAPGRRPPRSHCDPAATVPCGAPDRLHRVYGMGALYRRGITGAGTTIAVIVPYTDPWLGHDLAVYSRWYRLPAPQVAVIRLNHAPAASPGRPGAAGWAQEATADLEAAHFMAPGARLIYLAIPATPGLGPEVTAMSALTWLVTHRRLDVVSFSWGICEPSITRHAHPQ